MKGQTIRCLLYGAVKKFGLFNQQHFLDQQRPEQITSISLHLGYILLTIRGQYRLQKVKMNVFNTQQNVNTTRH